jgi:hypothetical protein
VSAQLECEGKELGLVTVDEAFDLVNSSKRKNYGLVADREALDCTITILEEAQSSTVLEARGENGKMLLERRIEGC